jgi:hypothetical protein
VIGCTNEQEFTGVAYRQRVDPVGGRSERVEVAPGQECGRAGHSRRFLHFHVSRTVAQLGGSQRDHLAIMLVIITGLRGLVVRMVDRV